MDEHLLMPSFLENLNTSVGFEVANEPDDSLLLLDASESITTSIGSSFDFPGC